MPVTINYSFSIPSIGTYQAQATKDWKRLKKRGGVAWNFAIERIMRRPSDSLCWDIRKSCWLDSDISLKHYQTYSRCERANYTSTRYERPDYSRSDIGCMCANIDTILINVDYWTRDPALAVRWYAVSNSFRVFHNSNTDT
ncbi:MAG: hypothetical protein ACTSV2_10025 [Candidatus Thorarchaeota archaeon]